MSEDFKILDDLNSEPIVIGEEKYLHFPYYIYGYNLKCKDVSWVAKWKTSPGKNDTNPFDNFKPLKCS